MRMIFVILGASVLLLGNAVAQARSGPKPFCTYGECMPRCQKSGGTYCSAYCTKEVASRRVSGVCK